MIVHRPKDLKHFLQINSSIRRDGNSPYIAFFRGQSKDWPIVPGVNRKLKFSTEEILERESKLLEEFLSSEELGFKIQQHNSKTKYKQAQKWLDIFQAQHIGVKTRLTDWTQSYENALSFALQNKPESTEDSVLWVYKCPNIEEFLINFNKHEDLEFLNLDPLDLPKTIAVKHFSMDEFYENVGEKRRFRQDGSFIISSSKDITKAIETIPEIIPYLEKIFINSSLKKEILEEHLNPELANYLYDKSDSDKIAEIEQLEENIKQLNSRFFS